MGPKRRKIACKSCKGGFDNDYCINHDEKYHNEKKQNKLRAKAHQQIYFVFSVKNESIQKKLLLETKTWNSNLKLMKLFN